jgi:hypothetical protein
MASYNYKLYKAQRVELVNLVSPVLSVLCSIGFPEGGSKEYASSADKHPRNNRGRRKEY